MRERISELYQIINTTQGHQLFKFIYVSSTMRTIDK